MTSQSGGLPASSSNNGVPRNVYEHDNSLPSSNQPQQLVPSPLLGGALQPQRNCGVEEILKRIQHTNLKKVDEVEEKYENT